MTWLIVGRNGQLGQALSLVLDQHGVEFCAWGSQDLDIRSPLKCADMILALRPQVVINAAAWTDVDGAESDPDGAHAVNALGALNLAVAAKAVGAIFAHISTDYVFSGRSDWPRQVGDSRSPVSAYGRSKAAGEIAVLREYAERSYIFRTAWLYSRWGKNFVKTMTHLALSRKSEVRVVDDQLGQPSSAIDVANQIVDTLIAKLPYGIYHATNSGHASWFDFACEVFKFSGASVKRIVPVSSKDHISRAIRPAYSVLGHDCWEVVGSSGVSVPVMPNWRDSLTEEMPTIIQTVRHELEKR